MQKIAVTSDGPDLDGPLDPRFGRAAGFIVIDPISLESEYFENGAGQTMAQGAGIHAAEIVVRSGAKAVITGHVGPKAFQALTAAGIRIGRNLSAVTVREAIEEYTAGKIKWVSAPDRRGHGR